MTATLSKIHALESAGIRKDLPDFRVGDTIAVHYKIVEGDKLRVQIFRGVPPGSSALAVAPRPSRRTSSAYRADPPFNSRASSPLRHLPPPIIRPHLSPSRGLLHHRRSLNGVSRRPSRHPRQLGANSHL